LNKNLLKGYSLRSGPFDNSYRTIDLNNDGYLDVLSSGAIDYRGRILGDSVARIWNPKTKQWREIQLPAPYMYIGANNWGMLGPRIGLLNTDGKPSLLLSHSQEVQRKKPVTGLCHFIDTDWKRDRASAYLTLVIARLTCI
jgi:hypothetical protein